MINIRELDTPRKQKSFLSEYIRVATWKSENKHAVSKYKIKYILFIVLKTIKCKSVLVKN